MQTNDWTARRILRELCDADRRIEILSAFWHHADDMSRRVATSQLAKSMHFREDSMRKLPIAKKAQLLASRIGAAEFEDFYEAALLAFHLAERKDVMAAFLDHWGIPHEDGAIGEGDYDPPSHDGVEQAVEALADRFQREDLFLYLATAGLVMGDEGSAWRNATWPVVDGFANRETSAAD